VAGFLASFTPPAGGGGVDVEEAGVEAGEFLASPLKKPTTIVFFQDFVRRHKKSIAKILDFPNYAGTDAHHHCEPP
jgi:hypothetical protein